MRGNNAGKWPENMNSFFQELSELPWNAFANNSTILYSEYIGSVKEAILVLANQIKKA